MNKKIISITFLTALYSILFYEQHVGINFLLFTIAMLVLFFFQDKEAFKNKSVLFLSFGAIFTASFAAVHGSYLSLWATIISLMVIPGVMINKRSNILLDFVTTLVNIAASFIFMIIEMINSGENGKEKGFLRLLKYLVPLVFIVAFFFIYRSMNPLFEKITQEIADLISLGYVFFTLGGFTLIYSVYKQKRANNIDDWESKWLINIEESEVKTPKWNEGVSFIFLFIALNLMLVSVNLMDINYLYLGEGMPDGITHKQFLHKGIGMLILSILLGISLLLFFFRGALNFSKNKTIIKLLAFLWVAQNVFMVISTTLRNNIYVNDALLSYKRIGVYLWLLFALIGLITLFIKLYKNKSVWFLARHNITVIFIALIMTSAFDWDMVISNFNINRAKQEKDISSYDKKYILSLSEGNIAGLYSIKNMKGFEVDSTYSHIYYRDYYEANSNWLDSKVFDFLENDSEADWRSFSVRRNRVRKDIKQLYQDGELDSFELQHHYIKSLKPIFDFKTIIKLNLSSSSFNSANQIVGLNKMKQLKTLNLSQNYIHNLDALSENENLKQLFLGTNELKSLTFLNNVKNLESLNLDKNPLNDIDQLSTLKKLKELSLNQMINNIGKFPRLNKLEKLSFSESKKTVKYSLGFVEQLPELREINLSHNELSNFNLLLNKIDESKTPKLTSLNINYNHFLNLNNIEKFNELETLDASNNQIYNANNLRELYQLKNLFLSNNKLTNIQFLNSKNKLMELNLANNNIDDFSPISHLTDLFYLNLSGTNFNNLNLIKATSTLQSLYLNGCKIKNWSSISSFISLTKISISFVKKEDIKYLIKIKALKSITITNTDKATIELMKKKMPAVEFH